jgi:hypothetical protein
VARSTDRDGRRDRGEHSALVERFKTLPRRRLNNFD